MAWWRRNAATAPETATAAREPEQQAKMGRRGLVAAAAAMVAGIAVAQPSQRVAAETSIHGSFQAKNGFNFESSGDSAFYTDVTSTISSGNPFDYGVNVQARLVGVNGYTVSGDGVKGTTSTGNGVHGIAGNNGTGVRGDATNISGVTGFATTGYGVQGLSGGNAAGVYGNNTSGNNAIGVQGTARTTGVGVLGSGEQGYPFSGIGVKGVSDSGTGVYGESGGASAWGVRAVHTAGGAGVYATGGIGVSGQSTASSGYGVYGTSTGSGGNGVRGESASNVGVYGFTPSNSNNTIGVEGNTNGGPGSRGVYGAGNGAGTYGVYGVNGSGIGVYGTATGYAVVGNTTGAGSVGVYGNSTQYAGVYGSSGSQTGTLGVSQNGNGVYGVSTGTNVAGVYGTATAAGSNSYGIEGAAGATGTGAGKFTGLVYINGPLVIAGGGKSAAVPHPDGSHRLLYCVEAPEAWFEDFGEGKLVAGRAEVRLDPDFAAVIDTSTMHAFVMPHDPSQAVGVTQRSARGFTAEVDAGAVAARGRRMTDINGTFSYRVVAKRKDIKAERLAKFVPPGANAKPTPLAAPLPEPPPPLEKPEPPKKP